MLRIIFLMTLLTTVACDGPQNRREVGDSVSVSNGSGDTSNVPNNDTSTDSAEVSDSSTEAATEATGFESCDFSNVQVFTNSSYGAVYACQSSTDQNSFKIKLGFSNYQTFTVWPIYWFEPGNANSSGLLVGGYGEIASPQVDTTYSVSFKKFSDMEAYQINGFIIMSESPKSVFLQCQQDLAYGYTQPSSCLSFKTYYKYSEYLNFSF